MTEKKKTTRKKTTTKRNTKKTTKSTTKPKEEKVLYDLSDVININDIHKFTNKHISKYKTNFVLSKDYYNILDTYFKNNPHRKTVKLVEQQKLLTVFNKTFSQRKSQTQCGPCFIGVLTSLDELYKFYKDNVMLDKLK